MCNNLFLFKLNDQTHFDKECWCRRHVFGQGQSFYYCFKHLRLSKTEETEWACIKIKISISILLIRTCLTKEETAVTFGCQMHLFPHSSRKFFFFFFFIFFFKESIKSTSSPSAWWDLETTRDNTQAKIHKRCVCTLTLTLKSLEPEKTELPCEQVPEIKFWGCLMDCQGNGVILSFMIMSTWEREIP